MIVSTGNRPAITAHIHSGENGQRKGARRKGCSVYVIQIYNHHRYGWKAVNDHFSFQQAEQLTDEVIINQQDQSDARGEDEVPRKTSVHHPHYWIPL